MFDYVDHKPVIEPGRPRYLTAGFSAVMHVVVVGLAVGLPILYASDELPEPPSMMAFVMDAVPPPPPPPPPAVAVAKKAATTAKPDTPALEQPKPIPQANPVAAPVEAPAAVTPETGLEANAGAARPAIEAGFENGVTGGVAGGIVGGIAGGIDGAPPPPPPAPKAPQGPVRVGGQVKAPQLTHRVNPTYPPMAQAANIEGAVLLEAQVNKAGRVESVRVVKGHSMLDQAAIAAVKQWQYEPLTLNGQAVEFILTVTVTFSIPR
jgi:protein TonB